MSVRSETHGWSADAYVRVSQLGACCGRGRPRSMPCRQLAAPLISTGLQPGVGAGEGNRRFNGFSFTASAPRRVKTVETVLPSWLADTRLKPGANERGRCAVGSVSAFLLS